jgi:hypothetical protein
VGTFPNPGGKIVNEKAFRDDLRMVAKEIDPVSKRRKLRRLAEKVFDLALAGEGWAANMIADRLDGKPVAEQTVNLNVQRDIRDYDDKELLAIVAKAQAEEERKDETLQ